MVSNKVESYEIVEVHRRQLRNAPYNPRKITDKARKRLKENIERVGLLEPPIWNESTGNIVGGHQRVKILDAAMGTQDYRLRVSRVSLSEQEEKLQNIFLNNPDAQGEFDLDKLFPLMNEFPAEFEKAGWDHADLLDIFGEAPSAIASAATGEVGEMLKRLKEQIKDSAAKRNERNEDAFYLVAVFASPGERLEFTQLLNLPDNRYVDGRLMAEVVKAWRDSQAEPPPDSPK